MERSSIWTPTQRRVPTFQLQKELLSLLLSPAARARESRLCICAFVHLRFCAFGLLGHPTRAPEGERTSAEQPTCQQATSSRQDARPDLNPPLAHAHFVHYFPLLLNFPPPATSSKGLTSFQWAQNALAAAQWQARSPAKRSRLHSREPEVALNASYWQTYLASGAPKHTRLAAGMLANGHAALAGRRSLASQPD